MSLASSSSLLTELYHFTVQIEFDEKFDDIGKVRNEVYSQTWFLIKSTDRLANSSKGVWETIHVSQQFSDVVKNVIDPVFQRKSLISDNIYLLQWSLVSDDTQ